MHGLKAAIFYISAIFCSGLSLDLHAEEHEKTNACRRALAQTALPKWSALYEEIRTKSLSQKDPPAPEDLDKAAYLLVSAITSLHHNPLSTRSLFVLFQYRKSLAIPGIRQLYESAESKGMKRFWSRERLKRTFYIDDIKSSQDILGRTPSWPTRAARISKKVFFDFAWLIPPLALRSLKDWAVVLYSRYQLPAVKSELLSSRSEELWKKLGISSDEFLSKVIEHALPDAKTFQARLEHSRSGNLPRLLLLSFLLSWFQMNPLDWILNESDPFHYDLSQFINDLNTPEVGFALKNKNIVFISDIDVQMPYGKTLQLTQSFEHSIVSAFPDLMQIEKLASHTKEVKVLNEAQLVDAFKSHAAETDIFIIISHGTAGNFSLFGKKLEDLAPAMNSTTLKEGAAIIFISPRFKARSAREGVLSNSNEDWIEFSRQARASKALTPIRPLDMAFDANSELHSESFQNQHRWGQLQGSFWRMGLSTTGLTHVEILRNILADNNLSPFMSDWLGGLRHWDASTQQTTSHRTKKSSNVGQFNQSGN